MSFSNSRKALDHRALWAGACRHAVAKVGGRTASFARRLGITTRGADIMLRGDGGPSFDTLIAACREFDECWDQFKVLCGRNENVAEAEALLAEFAAKINGMKK